ncbi:MAG: M28 family metallopeptidase [Pyrinomonadaceae bacterium]
MKKYHLLLLLVVFISATYGQQNNGEESEGSEKISMEATPFVATEVQISKDVEKVECDNKKRLDGVIDLFKTAGFDESALKITDYGSVKNMELVIPGATEEAIVVGAHYDNKGSCGALDNWTGIVVLANLAHTLKSLKPQKTFRFVAFGKEEEGAIGSKAYVKKIPKNEHSNYCAMINFDSFGITFPQAMGNISSKKLIDVAEAASKKLEIPFGSAPIVNASSDSASFLAKGIPAITMHGLDGNWMNYLHTRNDILKRVNMTSVYIAYRVAILMLIKVDGQACDAYR